MNIDIITANELAERLKVKPETIRIWAQKGLIPSIRITPKIIRFDLIAVLKALRSINSGEHYDR